MKHFIVLILLSLFATFVGSQITEGALLVVYWQSLPTQEFYSYFSKFGPIIGNYYTIFTLIASLIPIGISIYSFSISRQAFKYAVLASLCTFIFIAIYYLYFKEANHDLYQRTWHADLLIIKLQNWAIWHWIRVAFECVALLFLIQAIRLLTALKPDNSSFN